MKIKLCNMNTTSFENNKQIEDIIDARKRNGEYNITFNRRHNAQNSTCRYAYSAPRGFLEERLDECAMWNIEGDLNSDRDGNVASIGQTDSEITVVRVKRENLHYKESENNWDMHDKAIPGDGTHLGESPSLVNLVTLVNSSKESLHSMNSAGENVEYMVPLSSWEPLDESHEILNDSDSSVTSNMSIANVHPQTAQNLEIIKSPAKRSLSNLAAKLGIFFRKHFKKHKKDQDENE